MAAFLHQQNSLRIIPHLNLIAFYGFSQSKIIPMLFSANFVFPIMALCLKRKRGMCGKFEIIINSKISLCNSLNFEVISLTLLKLKLGYAMF